MRNHCGQRVAIYSGLCNSFSRYGPQFSLSLNKIVVFDDLCADKEMGHYHQLP